MPNNKNNPQGGSKNSMDNNPDREFDGQSKNKNIGGGGQGQQAGASRAKSPTDEDDVTTAGGREGQFSDKDRGSEGQWSPGQGKSSDQ